MVQADVRCRKCGHQFVLKADIVLSEIGQGVGILAECPKCKTNNGTVGMNMEPPENSD